jgi:transcription initiation factor TFIIIB Brf1 subunit/transcription initiation factor TFIIB
METSCPECGSLKIRNGSAEVICQKCGFVIDEAVFVN